MNYPTRLLQCFAEISPPPTKMVPGTFSANFKVFADFVYYLRSVMIRKHTFLASVNFITFALSKFWDQSKIMDCHSKK